MNEKDRPKLVFLWVGVIICIIGIVVLVVNLFTFNWKYILTGFITAIIGAGMFVIAKKWL